MNFNQLKYILAVSQSPSMSAAAKTLHMTPQALGMAVRSMEDELGMILLNRSVKGVVLTEDGHWLVDFAERFLAEIHQRQMLHQRHLPPERATVQIAVNHLGIDNDFWVQFLQHLFELAPQLSIKIDELPAWEVVKKVQRGDYTLGFACRTLLHGRFIDEFPQEIAFTPLGEGTLVCVANPRLPIANFATTSLKAVSKYRLFMYILGGEQLAPALAYILRQYHLDEDLKLESNYPIYKGKLMKGYGISLTLQSDIFSESFAQTETLKRIPVRDDVVFQIGWLKHQEETLSEAEQYFVQVLEEYVAARLQKG